MGRKSNNQIELEKRAQLGGWVKITKEIVMERILSGYLKEENKDTVTFDGFIDYGSHFRLKINVSLTLGTVYKISTMMAEEGRKPIEAVWNIGTDVYPMLIGVPYNRKVIKEMVEHTKEIREILEDKYSRMVANRRHHAILSQEEIAIAREEDYKWGGR